MCLYRTEDYGYLCTDTVTGILVQAEATLLCFIKFKLFNYRRLLSNNYQNNFTSLAPVLFFPLLLCHLPLFCNKNMQLAADPVSISYLFYCLAQ